MGHPKPTATAIQNLCPVTSLGLHGWRSLEHLLGEDPKPPKLPWGPEALALNRFNVCRSTCPAGGRWRVNQCDLLTSALQVGPELLQFSCSAVSDSVTPWTAARQASLSITNSPSLLKLMSIESVIPSNHLILCSPLLLPSIFPSIRDFSNELPLQIRWPNYWSFSLSISPSNEYSGLISFRIDCFDLLAIQRTLKSLLQHHSSKASLLWHSSFKFQLSRPYMTTGKTIAFTIWTFVGKVAF